MNRNLINDRAGEFAKNLVKLTSIHTDNVTIGKALSNLLSNSVNLVAEFKSALFEKKAQNSVKKLDSAILSASKSKFWLEFLYEESFINEYNYNSYCKQVSSLISDILQVKEEFELIIPQTYKGEWLLDD